MASPTKVDGAASECADAAVLLDEQGLITAANEPARRLLARWFPEWTNDSAPPEALRGWLRGPARIAEESPGPLVLRDADALLHIRRIDLGDVALILLRETDDGATIRRLRELGLTPREAEIVLIAAEGDTVGNLARRLGISGRTVEKHIQLAYDKLGVHNRVSAANLVGDLHRVERR